MQSCCVEGLLAEAFWLYLVHWSLLAGNPKACWLKPFGCVWCVEAYWLVIQKPVGWSLLAGCIQACWLFIDKASWLQNSFWRKCWMKPLGLKPIGCMILVVSLLADSICCVFPWCFHCSHQGFCSCSLLAQVMQRHLKAIKPNIYKTNRYSNTSIDIYIYMNCNDVDPRPFAMIITLQLPWVGSQNKKKKKQQFF